MSYKIKSIFYSMAFLLVGNTSYGENACPDWLMNRANNIPTCPEGGLVPETFPVGAVVVSDSGSKGKDSGFTADVVQKVLTASGNNNPLLLLPVSDETIQRVKSRIDEMPISDDLKKKYKQSILQVPTRGYTWQQDYFQPFTNPATGQIVLREVQGYGRHGDSFSKIIEATKSCGFQQGPTLSNDYFVNGHMGGNIETLPSGICLLGDDHFRTNENWESYANQICNSGSENRIKVPTSWLKVGHTDEIMKVVRNKNAQAPCDFSVVLASPKKAIELLKQNPNGKFMDFSNGRGGSPSELAIRRSNEYRGLRNLCRKAIEDRNSPRQDRDNNDRTKPTKGVTKLFELKSLFISEAHAGVSRVRGPSGGEPEDCANMTNGEVYRLLTSDNELKVFNQLVQEKMDSLKTEVSQKLKSKLPQCEPDFIEVPDVFFGGMPVEKEKGKYELPEGMGLSVLPNPTNAISVNDTLIAPDPSNDVFQKYMEEQYKKRGLKAEFVDTFDYAHQGEGNLHCSTNTIHICNPRGR